MATNRKYKDGDQLSLVATDPTTPSSGDPVVFGELPGVALNDEDSDGETTIQFNGVFELDVEAEGSAVTAGDIVYYDTADDGLNNDNSNVRFGYALEDVTSGSTTAIDVKVGY